jgi:Uma2 family endonuclease
MAALVLDPELENQLKRDRARCGADRYDEVWDGVYVMAPLANNEHQYLALNLAVAISAGFRIPDEAVVFAGCNVSDQGDDWTQNYRCPDVAAFLRGNSAQDRETHWFGGPDFAIEIVSPHDRSRDKLNFYFKVGVRELLLVDRKPWRLELYRAEGGSLKPVGACPHAKPKALESTVIPFSFTLVGRQPRPKVIVVRRADGHTTSI